MDTVPREVGLALKLACWRAAWYAANSMAGYEGDAAKAKVAQAKLESTIRELRAMSMEHGAAARVPELLSMDLIDDIAAMFSNAAWHAAYTRMGWGKDKSAAATKDEFEARYKYIADSGELSKRLCTHLKWMAWNAAWFTANTRAGNHQDAAKDKVGFERQARAVLGDIHRGVSLGGWLLLQRWMCASVFSGVSERDAWDEFSLCAHLGRELAERRIIAWRDSWILRDDFVELAQTGFNAVRLPLGYWCMEGLEALGLSYEPFVGPCMRYLDLAVEWCRELGLRLVLDLHAAPGFQNKKETCGRADEGWEAWTWNTEATVGVLALLASHYTQRGWAGVVRGISVLHAPSTDIPISDLVGFYCNAYSALRRGGMAESAVAIHFPVHYRSLERLRELGFPHNEMQNVILDLQLYHTKGDKWLSYKTQQHLEAAQDPASHTPGLPHVLAAGCEVCVSEWNLQLPFADMRSAMHNEWQRKTETERSDVICELAKRSLKKFSKTSSWYFWTWKVDVGPDDAAAQYASAKECVRKGWLWPGDFF